MEIHKLFQLMVKFDASDLHLKPGQPPVFRVQGKLSRMQDTPALTSAQIDRLLDELLSDEQWQTYRKRQNLDFSQQLDQIGRFRLNIFRQSGCNSAVIRRVNLNIPTLRELHLPEHIDQLSRFESGLILIGGITGAGKSTTLAALLNIINKTRRCHILTLEDPIEYVFQEDKAIINQRELGIDFDDFGSALREAVRQDPDVILLGEMRDAATIETALRAAETGHLVFGTIHASGAAQTIPRLIDFFPNRQQALIRSGIVFNLRCVINQRLVEHGSKRATMIPVIESLFMSPTIRKLILQGEDMKVLEAMKQDTEYGCFTYNQMLEIMHRQGLISKETALQTSGNPDELRIALQGIRIADGGIL